MARAIWTGVLTFGLVTVPVGMYAATDEHTIHFHQLERGTSDRIRYRKVNERTGDEVDAKDIVKGYQVDDGQYVIVEPEELDEIAPGRSQTIDIADFVDLADIPPQFFATTYYLAPGDKPYQKVYELLRQALAKSNRAGIATFVMRNKQYLAAVRAADELLVLHLLHWADEVRDPRKELPDLPRRRAAADKELKTALQLIDAMASEWDPGAYRDTYHDTVRQLVKDKAQGKEVVSADEAPSATNVIDLMSVLQESIGQASSRKGSKGSRTGKARRSTGKGAATRSGHGRTQAKLGGGAAKKTAAKKAGGGGRRAAGLDELSREELYERAKKAGVPGRSKMTRQQLLRALDRSTSGAA